MKKYQLISFQAWKVALFLSVIPLFNFLIGITVLLASTFGTLSQGGSGDPSAFAGVVSEAIMTALGGLVVAIPLVFLATYLAKLLLKGMGGIAIVLESEDE